MAGTLNCLFLDFDQISSFKCINFCIQSSKSGSTLKKAFKNSNMMEFLFRNLDIRAAIYQLVNVIRDGNKKSEKAIFDQDQKLNEIKGQIKVGS